MRDAQARITGKGQVQVPVSVRKKLGAEIGDYVLFQSEGDGRIYLDVRKQTRLAELGGVLKEEARPFAGLDVEEYGTRKAWIRKRVGEKK